MVYYVHMIRCVAFLVSALYLSAVFAAAPKYVFLFIGDGMSTPQRMVAEEFARANGRKSLLMNSLPYQANTRTRSANAIITDSAAAATAIACGVKTDNGMLGVDPRTNRLESVAEVAKKTGRKVGIVTTVTVVHATPGGFYAHRRNRGLSYQIALDLIASGFDYFCAGGVYDKFDDRKDAEYRGNVFDLARQAGYEVNIDDRQAWASLRPGGKSWSVFGANGMQFSIDADGSQPTLAEIVEKGIEVLDNPKGFFLMCEGGKVDYAGHANDAATNLREVLALDDAVAVALRFYERHPDETLVVTTGDHETGGLSMGFAGCGGHFKVELLAYQKISVEKFSNEVKALIQKRKGDISFDEVKPLLTEKFGFVFGSPDGKEKVPLLMSAADEKLLRETFEKDVDNVRRNLKDTTAHDVQRRYVFAQAAKNVMSSHAGIGWSTGSHTALPTLTTAKGVGAEVLVGMTENTEIGLRLKELLRK